MSILKSSLKFSLGTLISRMSGLVRESVVAYYFGASIIYDSFVLANRIPNMIRELACEGALGSSFTKTYSQQSKKNKAHAIEIFFNTLVVFSLLMLVVVVGGIFFSDEILKFFVLYRDSKDSMFFSTTSHLLKILFPFVFFMTIGSIFSGVLFERNRFFTSAVAPLLLNLGYIFGAVFIGPFFEDFLPETYTSYFGSKMIFGLCCGVLLGGAVQVSILGWLCAKHIKDFPKFSQLRKFRGIKKIFSLMIPMVIAGGSTQINVLVNTNFATSLGEGVLSWLSYAFRLVQLPIGLFAVAIGMSLLPKISKISDDKDKVSQYFQQSFSLCILLIIPCVCILMQNAYCIIDVLFGHGRFSENDIFQTASILKGYSLGLLGYGMLKILISFYYALDKTKVAMVFSLVTVLANFICNYFLVDIYGHVGLALTASFVMSLNALLLFCGIFSVVKPCFYNKDIFKLILWVLLASVLSFFISALLKENILEFFDFVNISKLKSILVLTGGLTLSSVSFLFVYIHNRNLIRSLISG